MNLVDWLLQVPGWLGVATESGAQSDTSQRGADAAQTVPGDRD